MSIARFAKKYCIVFFSAFVLLPNKAQAQPPHLQVAVSKNHILIGDTLTLKIRSEYHTALRQELGNPVDTLGIFEILSRSQPTIDKQNDIQHFAQDITLIAFDAGNFEIPSFKIAYINQESGATNTIATQAIAIQIDSISVDTQQDIKPIKPPIDVPLTWRDYIPYALAAIAAIAAIWGFIWYRRRPKKVAQAIVPEEPPRPAHEIALAQLQQLAQARYWQQNEIKRYYSELSDIMRQYVSKRYNINATEQTTDEIVENLQHLDENNNTSTQNISNTDTDHNATLDTTTTTIIDKQKPITAQQIKQLQSLLQTADMVKFAKAQPDIDTHGKLLESAEQWVRNTKTSIDL